jgi:putative mRNA 3-end processing factor
MADLLTVTPQGLHCAAGDFHVDPWQPVPRALITHAHADHALPGHGSYLCAPGTEALLRHRLGPEVKVETGPWREARTLGSVRVSFHPAGHVLGAAQLRVEGEAGIWGVTGDFKRQPDPTAEPFEPIACDVLITEATFGLPVYRWDPTEHVIGELLEWHRANAAAGRTSVLFCYALGKAQRILAQLRHHLDRPVYVHGAIEAMNAIYREAGIALPETLNVVDLPKAKKLKGELVLAPLSARGTPWMKRLGNVRTAFASGFMRVRGNRRRRAFDKGFVLSDHADWPALLQTVADTGARRVLVTHGYAVPFARYLRERGLDAEPLETPFEGERED